MRILVIEDNLRLAHLIGQGIADRGFTPDLMAGLKQAEQALQSTNYDAIVLDLNLPDGDGLAWLRRKRASFASVPVLIVTSRNALGDRVAGLDGGADDYLVKPVEVEELAARLRALLRRPGPRGPTVIQIGKLAYDVATRTARFDAIDINLARREADLLELLMRRAGAIVRRSTIAEALYSFEESTTPNAIEAAVSRLRHKLMAAGAEDILRTVRGIGYMLQDSAR